MRIKIPEDLVRQNIEIFLRILRKVKENQKEKNFPLEKVFKAWLNQENGAILFVKPDKGQVFEGKKWKSVSLLCKYDSEKESIFFTIVQKGNQRIQSSDLDPVAFQVLHKTMKIFQQISQLLKGPSNLDTKIAVLSKLIIHSGISEETSLLMDLWHPLNRLDAESLLEKHPIGSYFFRKDFYADLLEKELIKNLRKKIKCFTLTFSQDRGKITDLTVLHVDGKWQIYNDDPTLEQRNFSTLKKLMHTQNKLLKFPLYRIMEIF